MPALLNDCWFSAFVGFVVFFRGLISLVRTQFVGWLPDRLDGCFSSFNGSLSNSDGYIPLEEVSGVKRNRERRDMAWSVSL